MSDYDQAPYTMIGVATVIHGRTRKAANPIGFIWPKRQRPAAKRAKARKKK
jgi:hypothetical protein